MREAAFLVQPSLAYENCGLAVVEALAAGLPSVVTGHGSFVEIVEHGRTGLHVRAGDAADLASKVTWMAAHNDERDRMRQAARSRFEQHFSPERNYAELIRIYCAAQRHLASKRSLAAGA